MFGFAYVFVHIPQFLETKILLFLTFWIICLGLFAPVAPLGYVPGHGVNYFLHRAISTYILNT